jgi:hypothetical protein
MKCKQVNGPGHGIKIIDMGQGCIEKGPTERQFKNNPHIDQGIGNKIKKDWMTLQKSADALYRGAQQRIFYPP